MIVFTIYKNGGNAGVFGASFSCAIFCAGDRDRCGLSVRSRGRSIGNTGARVIVVIVVIVWARGTE